MNNKHTKGIWGAEAAMSSDFGNIRYITCDLPNRTSIIAEIRHNKDQEQEEALANAKLIAAAPLLYDAAYSALQAIYAMPKSKQEFYKYLINDLLNAIQKANGTIK